MAVGLVGRDGEVACLRGLVAGVVGGRGGSVWVQGEPGIGKSAVLAVGLAGAGERGCRVVWVAAGGGLLLGGLGGGGGGAVAVAGDAVAGDAVAVVERWCGQSPVVLVAEDLQWADALSLSVWGRLQALVGQLPLLLVGACRPVPVRAELVALRRGLVGERPVVIRLGPLAPAQVAQVVGGLVGAAPGPGLLRQAALAGGNPLYVGELVAALVGEGAVRVQGGVAQVAEGTGGSGSLTAGVAGRLGFLSVPAVGVLRVAALFGEAFSVEDLTVVTGRPATELAPILDEAVVAGVVAAGAELRFRHGLIRQALYEAMSLSLRSALHRQAAQALAEAGVGVERVAAQLLAAGVVDAWVVGWAAEVAVVLAQRAPQLAVELLGRVRGVVGADGPRRARVDAGLATALFVLGRDDQVELVARPVLAATCDAQVVGQLSWVLASALHRMERHGQALQVLHAALQDRAIPQVWGARARALQGVVLVGCGRAAAAHSAAVRAEAEGVGLGDRLAVGVALHALSLVCGCRNDQAGALQAVERALATVGQEPELAELRLVLLGRRAGCLVRLGRLAEVESAIGAAVLQAARAGTSPVVVSIRLQAAEHWYGSGGWDQALAALAAAAEVPQAPAMRLWRHGLGALIAAHRDDRAGLGGHVQAVRDLDLGAGSLKPLAGLLLAAQAVGAERDGQPQRALALLLGVVEVRDPARCRREGELGDRWVADAVRLALAVGDIDLARGITHAAVASAEGDQGPVAVAAAQHCRGLLAADPAVVLAAADHYQGCCLPLLWAQALENAAVLFAQQDQLPAARSAYTQALTVYSGLGAAWDIRRADCRLRPLRVQRGARGPRRRPASGWDALTPSELTIAELVAAGLSNPSIAAELFLSQRTVQTHISHILAKLGGRSRVDIARTVLAHQLTTAG